MIKWNESVFTMQCESRELFSISYNAVFIHRFCSHFSLELTVSTIAAALHAITGGCYFIAVYLFF